VPATVAIPLTIIVNDSDLVNLDKNGLIARADSTIPTNILDTTAKLSAPLVLIALDIIIAKKLIIRCIIPKWYKIAVSDDKKINIGRPLNIKLLNNGSSTGLVPSKKAIPLSLNPKRVMITSLILLNTQPPGLTSSPVIPLIQILKKLLGITTIPIIN
jgi:hypothetical protein